MVDFRAQLDRLSAKCLALDGARCCPDVAGGVKKAMVCPEAEPPTQGDIASEILPVPPASNGVHDDVEQQKQVEDAEDDEPPPKSNHINSNSYIENKNPLSANPAVLRVLADLVGGENYLFFAPVSKAWLEAWRSSNQEPQQHTQQQQRLRQQPTSGCGSSASPHSTLTRAMTRDTTPSQLAHCFDSGLRRQHPRVCQSLAALGRLDLLRLARAGGCPLDKATSTQAALGGHLEVLRWAHESGCPLTTSTCAAAAAGGHLEVLRWARANGCPWDASTCSIAALKGRLRVLRWALGNRCPCDEETCAFAAKAGHLEVLRWARANRCPWSEMTCAAAAGAGRLDVLRWVRKNGCPWDEETCAAAARGGHLRVLQWAREKGCPWDEEACLNTLFEFWRRQSREEAAGLS